jgi:hypothetical protein
MIIELSAETQGTRDILCIRFPFNAVLNRLLRTVPGLHWNITRRCWYATYSATTRELLAQLLAHHNHASVNVDRRRSRVEPSFQFALL